MMFVSVMARDPRAHTLTPSVVGDTFTDAAIVAAIQSGWRVVTVSGIDRTRDWQAMLAR